MTTFCSLLSLSFIAGAAYTGLLDLRLAAFAAGAVVIATVGIIRCQNKRQAKQDEHRRAQDKLVEDREAAVKAWQNERVRKG